MTKYRLTIVILGTLVAASAALTLQPLLQGGDLSLIVTSIIAVVSLSAILVAHIRGWRWSAEATVICVMLLTHTAATPDYLRDNYYLPILVPPVVAAALLSPVWALASFGVMAVAAIVTTWFSTGSLTPEALGPTFSFTNLVIAIILVVGIATASAMARQAQRVAEENARSAAAEKTRAEEQAQDLAKANGQMNAQIEQQRQLIDLVATLETPAVPLAEGVLLAPIVGHLDTRRAQTLTSRLLEHASEQRARQIILDIAGVTLIDTAVAKALLNTAQALRLLGCEVTLSGISATVAITLVQLGVGMEGITTVRSPQEALSRLLVEHVQKQNAF
jgi:rsbT co-antagonist protein RsbR